MKRLIDIILLIVMMASSPAQATILTAEVAEELRETR